MTKNPLLKNLIYKNTKITYSDIGKGTAVVLLHGFLENQKMWHPFISEWSKQFRIITIDLLGHGQTECMGYVHTMEDHAAMVHEVVSKLRIRKIIIVGHSMGGYVGLAFAALYPSYIKGLVLLNSTSKADSEERKINRDRAIKAVKQSFENFISLAVTNLFSKENRVRLSKAVEEVKQEALKTPLQGIIASLEGMKIRPDRKHLLQLTSFPKLLVLGKKDSVLNYEETKMQLNGTTTALLTLPDGHMSHIENQDIIQSELLQFFKSIK